jgi:hypothetical protein
MLTNNDPKSVLINRMVGLAGFEPTASSSRTKRATRLRYSPLLATAKEK